MKVEVVTNETAKSYHARIKGENNEIVWVTESYEDKKSAYGAIDFLTEGLIGLRASAVEGQYGEKLLIEEVIE